MMNLERLTEYGQHLYNSHNSTAFAIGCFIQYWLVRDSTVEDVIERLKRYRSNSSRTDCTAYDHIIETIEKDWSQWIQQKNLSRQK